MVRASTSAADGGSSQQQDVLQGSEGPIERLRRSAPFFSVPDMVAPDVVYDGPLAKFFGDEAYVAAMSAWGAYVPSRLEECKVENVTVFSEPPQGDEVRTKAAEICIPLLLSSQLQHG